MSYLFPLGIERVHVTDYLLGADHISICLKDFLKGF